jgi:uncharacterized protein YndB with AHSA1/START domain
MPASTLHPPVTKSITIDALSSRVWSALITPDLMERWMSHEALTITSEWRVGSPILFRGQLHDIAFENRGVIQKFEPKRILHYNYWSILSHGRLADVPENYSMVCFELTPYGEGTQVTLAQSDFADISIYQHARMYWNGALQNLKAVCETQQ